MRLHSRKESSCCPLILFTSRSPSHIFSIISLLSQGKTLGKFSIACSKRWSESKDCHGYRLYTSNISCLLFSKLLSFTLFLFQVTHDCLNVESHKNTPQNLYFHLSKVMVIIFPKNKQIFLNIFEEKSRQLTLKHHSHQGKNITKRI